MMTKCPLNGFAPCTDECAWATDWGKEPTCALFSINDSLTMLTNCVNDNGLFGVAADVDAGTVGVVGTVNAICEHA